MTPKWSLILDSSTKRGSALTKVGLDVSKTSKRQKLILKAISIGAVDCDIGLGPYANRI